MTAAVLYTPEVILEHRIAWINRLRSGKYTQHTNALATVTSRYTADDNQERTLGHCCIGAAIDGMHEWDFSSAELTPYTVLSDDQSYHYDYFRAYMGVPRVVGSIKFDGSLTKRDFVDHLIQMNDTRHRSFKFIARFLEVYWGIKVPTSV